MPECTHQYKVLPLYAEEPRQPAAKAFGLQGVRGNIICSGCLFLKSTHRFGIDAAGFSVQRVCFSRKNEELLPTASHRVNPQLLHLPHENMRASRLSMRIGCALGAWAPTSAFVVPNSLSSGFISASSRQRAAVGACAPPQWRPRAHNRLQTRLMMSSPQSLNPESFTERAWEAMGRLPALADLNQAQVTLRSLAISYLL